MAFSQEDSSGIIWEVDSVYTPTKSSTEAVLKSAILPGWGQYYNESYWKIPVFWSIGGWLIYNVIINNNSYNSYRNLFEESGFQIQSYKRLRDFYKDQRDLFIIYIGITYLANLVDAYVDSQLFDFDVTEDFYTQTGFFRIKFRF